MTEREFAPIVAMIVATTQRPMDELTVKAWYRLLEFLPAKAVEIGVDRVLRESQYPGLPAVGKVHQYATEAAYGASISHTEAFAKVKEAISRFGYPEPEKAHAFLGESIWAAIQGIGGWIRVCDSEDPVSLQAHFRDSWGCVATRQHQLALPEAIRPRLRQEGQSEPSVLGGFIGEAINQVKERSNAKRIPGPQSRAQDAG